MLNQTVPVQFFDTSSKRDFGLMGRRPSQLAGKAFAFIYAFEAERLFHTFFCPAMRLLAFSEAGVKLFDRVVERGQFVRVPATRLIIESHPDTDTTALERELSAKGVAGWVEGWHQ